MKLLLRKSGSLRSGLTLVEVVLALGLVGIGLTLILASMTHVLSRERNEREKILAWGCVEQLQAELSLPRTWQRDEPSNGSTWSDEGRLLAGALPLSALGFASEESPLVLAFGEDGEALFLLDGSSYEQGLGEETEAFALLAFWGQRRDAVMEVQAQVEFPAALSVARRRVYEAKFAVSVLR